MTEGVIRGADSHGRYLEEFSPGQQFEHWPGHTVTEYENQAFTLLTGNPSAAHLDVEFSKRMGHPDLLVNGVLVLAIVHGASVRDLSCSPKAIAQLGWNDVRILSPTYPGDTLYASSEVLSTRESKSKPDRGIVEFFTRGTNQRGDLVISYERTVMVYRQGHGPETRTASDEIRTASEGTHSDE